jgi:hypothetical protein
MEYLMKEEIKPGRSGDYYNVAQSDLRALVWRIVVVEI